MNSSDFSKFLERELQSVIGSSFTKYIQETYKNNKKQITRFCWISRTYCGIHVEYLCGR